MAQKMTTGHDIQPLTIEVFTQHKRVRDLDIPDTIHYLQSIDGRPIVVIPPSVGIIDLSAIFVEDPDTS